MFRKLGRVAKTWLAAAVSWRTLTTRADWPPKRVKSSCSAPVALMNSIADSPDATTAESLPSSCMSNSCRSVWRRAIARRIAKFSTPITSAATAARGLSTSIATK